MASRGEAERLLGVSLLRKVRSVVRPDLYTRNWDAREDDLEAGLGGLAAGPGVWGRHPEPIRPAEIRWQEWSYGKPLEPFIEVSPREK